MTRAISIFLAMALLAGCASNGDRAPERKNPVAPESAVTRIDDLAAVPPVVAGGNGRTLVVFDIDDTLLTSETFFGSAYWYEWQKGLAANDPARPPCRFDVIALKLEAGTERPTQADGPRIVASIDADKLFLTGRNPAYRGATIRELQRAGYPLPRPLGGLEDGIIYRWRQDAGARPVLVSYHDGVFMVGGQDKGALLLDLLKRLRVSYDRVVLVDDGAANIEAMGAALKDAGIGYHGFHYTRIAKTWPLDPALAEKAKKAWMELSRFLRRVFPERMKELEAGQCFY